MNKDTNQIMALIDAYKMDGLGNNFLIIDRRQDSLEISKEKIVIENKQQSEIASKEDSFERVDSELDEDTSKEESKKKGNKMLENDFNIDNS